MLAIVFLIILWFRPHWRFLLWSATALLVIQGGLVWFSYYQGQQWIAEDPQAGRLMAERLLTKALDGFLGTLILYPLLGAAIIAGRKRFRRRSDQITAEVEGANDAHAPATVHLAQTPDAAASNSTFQAPPPSNGSKTVNAKGVNWRRGLTRVFWVLTPVWWVMGSVLFVFPYPYYDIPRRDEFVPDCAFVADYDRLCGPRRTDARTFEEWREEDPFRRQRAEASSDPSLLGPEYLACRARENEVADARARACMQRRDSEAGQRQINQEYRDALLSWGGGLPMLVAFVAGAPFLVALALFGMWRLGRWLRNGFRPPA